MRFLFLTMLLVTAGLAVACGGSGREANISTSGTSGATAAASASTADATSAPSVPLTDDERSRAAATAIFHGVIDPVCSNDSPVNGGGPCILPRSSAETTAGGIAVFGVRYEAGGDYLGVLGRTPGGEWQYWAGSQQPYLLVVLPGDMRVCADGDGLNLRSEPVAAAAQVTLLADGTIVRGDMFVLTERGDANAGKWGYGWYHITAPQDGWAYSKFLSNAQIGDCSVRDMVERAR